MRERTVTPRTASGASLFLMELLIAILVFSLSAAICVQLFVRAHTLSEESRATQNAVLWSGSVSSCFQAAGGSLEDTAVLLQGLEGAPACRLEEENLTLSFDDGETGWVPAAPGEGEYRLVLSLDSREENVVSARLTVTDGDGETLYAHPVSVLTPEEVAP